MKVRNYTQTNEPSKTSTSTNKGFACEVPSKSSAKILNNSESESTSLSQHKQASCSIFCNYPPFKMARLNRKFSKMFEICLAKNSGTAEEKEPE